MPDEETNANTLVVKRPSGHARRHDTEEEENRAGVQ